MEQNIYVTAVFAEFTPVATFFGVLARANGTKSGLSDLDSSSYPVPFRRKNRTVDDPGAYQLTNGGRRTVRERFQSFDNAILAQETCRFWKVQCQAFDFQVSGNLFRLAFFVVEYAVRRRWYGLGSSEST
ncbi:MAG: hypothetical protein IPJ30_24615 [Acidobacteria bacterium]|nr:hypothetical protein [Acidobacteriota bacterium]